MTYRQHPTIPRMYLVIVAHKGSLCNSAAKVLRETDKSCQKSEKNIEKQRIFQQKNEKKYRLSIPFSAVNRLLQQNRSLLIIVRAIVYCIRYHRFLQIIANIFVYGLHWDAVISRWAREHA